VIVRGDPGPSAKRLEAVLANTATSDVEAAAVAVNPRLRSPSCLLPSAFDRSSERSDQHAPDVVWQRLQMGLGDPMLGGASR